MTTEVRDAKPPAALLAVLNPVMRFLLRTPAGRMVRPFALLEFQGRRSGRLRRVPVGWHIVAGEPLVFTPAPWRANFGSDTPVVVYAQGRRRPMLATLVSDADAVATALRTMTAGGEPLKRIGVKAPKGHAVTAADVATVNRALLRFREVS